MCTPKHHQFQFMHISDILYPKLCTVNIDSSNCWKRNPLCIRRDSHFFRSADCRRMWHKHCRPVGRQRSPPKRNCTLCKGSLLRSNRRHTVCIRRRRFPNSAKWDRLRTADNERWDCHTKCTFVPPNWNNMHFDICTAFRFLRYFCCHRIWYICFRLVRIRGSQRGQSNRQHIQLTMQQSFLMNISCMRELTDLKLPYSTLNNLE